MRLGKVILGIVALALSGVVTSAQGTRVRFAFLTDLHYATDSPAVSDLRTCIRDLNTRNDLDFVLVGGDLTEFGSDEEIFGVKKMLDSLRCKYYVVAGNHDSKWSESGCNTFRDVFGYERFAFNCKGWRFIGCNSGPDMRMAPALLPQESLQWLKELPPGEKTVFVNHYPLDSSMLNYFDVTRELKRIGTRLVIGGHWHSDVALNYDGLPGVLCRSTLSAGNRPGYTVFTLDGDRVSASECRIYGSTTVRFEPWYCRTLTEVHDTVTYDADGLPADYPWMRFDVNEKQTPLKQVWKRTDDSNIAAGFAWDRGWAWYPTTSGMIRCLYSEDGRCLWSKQFPGKIFSTPAVAKNTLVFGCADGNVYALRAKSGRLLWKYSARKSVLGSPVLYGGKVYIGASDGAFRALDLKSGRPVWTFSDVEGFVESRPYVDAEQVVFGSWGGRLYSLDPDRGSLQWSWKSPRESRMYSPAATWPVKAAGKIFIAVPDRRLYVLDARTGKEIKHFDNVAREAVGLSADGKTVYCKAMSGTLTALDAETLAIRWQVDGRTGYDISPTAIVEAGGMVLLPTDKGNLLLFDTRGTYLGARKISTALVNPLTVWTDSRGRRLHLLVSTMDGTIAYLQEQNQ
ncbi:MAG: PQQ-binding-like beta-propeller repeat protein [Bacteroidales bacterium]|nr:PQQ-binding-like beta-propeller repeat protein [Bacteroidales bacterium]